MKTFLKLTAAATALGLVTACASIGADQNADGTYKPAAKLPDDNIGNRVDDLAPRVPGNQGPDYSRTEDVRSQRKNDDELLGGPE